MDKLRDTIKRVAYFHLWKVTTSDIADDLSDEIADGVIAEMPKETCDGYAPQALPTND